MTDQWERIQDLLASALELDPADRDAFLQRECPQDETLRKEILSLIDYHRQAQDFFKAPAIEQASDLFGEDRVVMEQGLIIGSYKIIRQIARGGMGAVYLGSRADDEYRKRVAIKVIRRGMDTEAILKRFRNERQILAALDHPNIAKLLDGGTTEGGLPYFVMEYIDGEPIDEYCDSKKLAITERLKLFQEVCSAIHYAHRNLVVHRDLKPSNILVTEEGMAKLLDFGVAKLLNPELASQTIAPTATEVRLLTPDYASPEQIRGQAITTASDVYSLGVLLYRLLAGHHPYQIRSRQIGEIERVVCGEEPEKPSTAMSRVEEVTTGEGTKVITPEQVSRSRSSQPDRLRRRLSGDLDNIVLMAMRKEPERRYSSVAELSEDIRRYLEGMPVTARKDTLSYRSAKFIKRHKAGVGAALLVLLTLIGGIIATLQQTRIATDQRNKARIEAAKAEQVNAFLQRMLSSADPNWYVEGGAKGPNVRVIDVLKEASRRIETELNDQPEIKAELHLTIGNTYRALGLYDAAERHFQYSLDLRRSIFGEDHPDVVESLYYLAAASYLKGDYDSAEHKYRKVLAILRANPGLGSVYLPHAMDDLAGVLLDRGDNKTAESLYRESFELFRGHYGDQHVVIPLSASRLSRVHEDRGELDLALAQYQKSLEDIELLPGEPPSDRAEILFLLARVYLTKGDYEAAERAVRQGLDICRRSVGDAHPSYANGLVVSGEYLYKTGDYAKSEEATRKALEIYRKRLPEGHLYFAQPLTTQGLILTAGGEAARGEADIRKGLEILNRGKIEGHWTIARAKWALGKCLAAQKRYAEAEPLLLESHTGLKSGLGEQNAYTAEALKQVIALYEAWERPEQAKSYSGMLSKSGQ